MTTAPSGEPLPRTLLVGCGKLGITFVQGWLRASVDRGRIDAVVATEASAAKLGSRFGIAVHVGTDAVPAGVRPEAIVLATPGYDVEGVLAACRRFANRDSVFLSMIAGIPMSVHEAGLGPAAAVVCSSSNVGALAGRGCFGLYRGPSCDERRARLGERALSPIGECVWLDGEDQLSVATAISGCSIAYFMLMAEGLAAAAVERGMAPERAMRLARAALSGAGDCVRLNADETLPDFRKRLTNPGGSTETGMNVLLRDGQLPRLIGGAVTAIIDLQKERWKTRSAPRVSK